jgi:hypothetical protein
MPPPGNVRDFAAVPLIGSLAVDYGPLDFSSQVASGMICRKDCVLGTLCIGGEESIIFLLYPH